MTLWRLPATEIARMVRTRAVSAREVAQDALARLDAVNGRISAVVEHRPDDVLAQAAAIDAALAQGENPGPLAGVPVTIKINADQAGFATTNGVTLQRDLIAKDDSPVVANLRRAGAVLLGRTNAPAFSLRWFTDNRLHGRTSNPRDPALTPGGSSGGAAAAVASGIGALAHGTDIAGSVRYPAYACGVHGLRPSLGRVPAWNASSPERGIGPQLMAVSGPIARTIADLGLGLHAMAAGDPRDPWWVPAPLAGPDVPRRAALCLRPGGLAIVPEVEAALRDAARRLEAAGWAVAEIADTPPIREAAELQLRLWLGDGFSALAGAAEREGDPGALALMRAFRPRAEALAPDAIPAALTRRATLVRAWQIFLAHTPVLLVPVSATLPFADGRDLQGDAALAAVWEAQLLQSGLPLIGMPALTVATGLCGTAPVGVQVVAARFREDLCLLAGAAIEAGGVPPAPIDPA
ncbi:amidase family protein [uncultured Methylobacterium sp.]|uniref:amidase family protein n=1 Tax=uncultured Methylobacterium sp. TaxID=157278 RepID=UPI0035CC513F